MPREQRFSRLSRAPARQLSERDHAARRALMIEELRVRGVHDERVLSAMSVLPRHHFLPPALRHAAYVLGAAGPAEELCLDPLLMAVTAQALALEGSERVLEIGTGASYPAALLGKLAHRVYSVNTSPERADEARALLRKLGILNVEVVDSDGSSGWPEAAPYDGIAVHAFTTHVPLSLLNQLASGGGRLVIALGDAAQQLLTLLEKYDCSIHTETLTSCALPALDRGPSERPSFPWVDAPGKA